jgi:N-dimethylarginine dimethylaminohydrolase
MDKMPTRSTEALLAKKAELVRKNKVGKAITPSQYAFPCFVLCPPVYADTKIANNPWMKGVEKIDREKFMAQWFNFYTVLSSNALVYLVTPVKGLQDQTYLNSAVYLPHLKKSDVIILSNFTAPGRPGEEVMSGGMLKELGYQVFQCPFKFEAEPELKFLHDNIYIGGYGIRTDIKALQWIRDNFEARIIPMRETDPKIYHLDCSVFPLTKEDTMICTSLFTDEEVKRVEKVTNVISVSKNGAYFGICNSLKVDDVVFNASNLLYLKKGDEEYTKERAKNDELEKICRKLGLEVIYFDLSECEKQGAYLSCFCMTLSNASLRV